MSRGLVSKLITVLLISTVSIVASACSSSGVPATTPGNSPVPTKPAAETSKASTSAPAKGAEGAKPSAVPASSPAASADWQAEWDRTVAAAKKEGKVIIGGGRSEPYRLSALEFEKAYPEIKVEYTGFNGQDLLPRMMAERQAGQYLWDVLMSGATPFSNGYKPSGVLEPLKPEFLLPEVLDNSKWVGGLDDGWMDNEQQYVYSFDGSVNYLAYVNRDLVPESELNSIDQLLDPKWKGKITIFDPRIDGTGLNAIATMLLVKGEDWLRKFLSQDLVIPSEARQQSESVFRGKYPIGIRLSPADMATFKQQGLTTNVKPLEPDGPGAGVIGSGYCCMALVNQPHDLNAAKVFINWFLSKEGQTLYAKYSSNNSRRLDIESNGNPETMPNPNVKYAIPAKEVNLPLNRRASEIAKEMIK